MKLELKIIDENGKDYLYNLNRSSSGEPKTLDDFILKALSISEDKRKLPVVIHAPNGIEFTPVIKMWFDGHGSPLLGDKLVKMIIQGDY